MLVVNRCWSTPIVNGSYCSDRKRSTCLGVLSVFSASAHEVVDWENKSSREHAIQIGVRASCQNGW